jgi:flagellar biosynthesis/type III secretory pathway protein FliH
LASRQLTTTDWGLRWHRQAARQSGRQEDRQEGGQEGRQECRQEGRQAGSHASSRYLDGEQKFTLETAKNIERERERHRES